MMWTGTARRKRRRARIRSLMLGNFFCFRWMIADACLGVRLSKWDGVQDGVTHGANGRGYPYCTSSFLIIVVSTLHAWGPYVV